MTSEGTDRGAGDPAWDDEGSQQGGRAGRPAESAPAAAEASVDPSDPYARERQTFPKLPEEAIERVRAYGREEALEDGAIVFARGDRSVDFLLVIEGAVEIIDRDATGGERVNTVHGPSQFTGELDLFNDRKILVDGRVRGAEGGGPARIVRVARPDFRRMISGEPDLGETITRAFILRRTGFIVHEEAGVALIGPAGSADALRIERFLRRNGYPVRALDPSTARPRRRRA